MSERWSLRAAALVAAAATAGCGSPREPARPKEPQGAPAIAKDAQPDLSTGPFGEHRSERFGLRVPLPDRPSWTIDDKRWSFLLAEHWAAATTLVARVWREEEPANRERCEARFREVRALPAREGAEVIEERRIGAPKGFDTVVTVGVVASGRGPTIQGFALAFGANARRCFAYAAVTSAGGKGAEELVATRLATMVELSLSNVALEDDREPVIPHDPGPHRGER